MVDQPPEQSVTEWLCVDVAGYKIMNVYKLAIHTYGHPDFSTHQSVRWRLQLPACQLGFQKNTS